MSNLLEMHIILWATYSSQNYNFAGQSGARSSFDQSVVLKVGVIMPQTVLLQLRLTNTSFFHRRKTHFYIGM